jgi:dienelactone hydrolase
VRLAGEGYTVYTPVLFGELGGSRKNGLTLITRCASRDYNCARNELSPISTKIVALAEFVHGQHPNDKLGVIGMCLTGNLPLAVGDKHYVGGVVLSQPALPVAIGPWKRRTGLSTEDVHRVRNDLPIIGLGFENDCIGPRERLVALEETFRGHFQRLELKEPSDDYHAVLTDALHHEEARKACEEVVRFLGRNVKGQEPTGEIKACAAPH